MAWYEYLVGKSVGERVVIALAVLVYVYLIATRPEAALESIRGGLSTLLHLFTLVLAAILLASALAALLPEEAVVHYLGSEGGPAGVVGAGLVGGLLLGGPYATYPIMKSVHEQGASYPALLAMYLGYGWISIGRVPYGLVFFSPSVVGIRLAFAVGLTIVAAIGIYLVASVRSSADESDS